MFTQSSSTSTTSSSSSLSLLASSFSSSTSSSSHLSSISSIQEDKYSSLSSSLTEEKKEAIAPLKKLREVKPSSPDFYTSCGIAEKKDFKRLIEVHPHLINPLSRGLQKLKDYVGILAFQELTLNLEGLTMERALFWFPAQADDLAKIFIFYHFERGITQDRWEKIMDIPLIHLPHVANALYYCFIQKKIWHKSNYAISHNLNYLLDYPQLSPFLLYFLDDKNLKQIESALIPASYPAPMVYLLKEKTISQFQTYASQYPNQKKYVAKIIYALGYHLTFISEKKLLSSLQTVFANRLTPDQLKKLAKSLFLDIEGYENAEFSMAQYPQQLKLMMKQLDDADQIIDIMSEFSRDPRQRYHPLYEAKIIPVDENPIDFFLSNTAIVQAKYQFSELLLHHNITPAELKQYWDQFMSFPIERMKLIGSLLSKNEYPSLLLQQRDIIPLNESNMNKWSTYSLPALYGMQISYYLAPFIEAKTITQDEAARAVIICSELFEQNPSQGPKLLKILYADEVCKNVVTLKSILSHISIVWEVASSILYIKKFIQKKYDISFNVKVQNYYMSTPRKGGHACREDLKKCNELIIQRIIDLLAILATENVTTENVTTVISHIKGVAKLCWQLKDIEIPEDPPEAGPKLIEWIFSEYPLIHCINHKFNAGEYIDKTNPHIKSVIDVRNWAFIMFGKSKDHFLQRLPFPLQSYIASFLETNNRDKSFLTAYGQFKQKLALVQKPVLPVSDDKEVHFFSPAKKRNKTMEKRLSS